MARTDRQTDGQTDGGDHHLFFKKCGDNYTISSIESLIPESTITKSRSKHALLPFIGKLSKGLFGTATMDDFNILLIT